MNKNALAVLVLILAAPAGAQEYRRQQAQAAEEAYLAMQAAARDHAAAEYSGIRGRALDVTIDAMAGGPVAAGRVLHYLDAHKTDVQFGTISEPVGSGVVNGRAAVLISDALYPQPPVYAALIAAEAAKAMYADMPACAERDYMRLATASRVYAELGGDVNASPTVDAEKAAGVCAMASLWTAGPVFAVEQLARVNHVPSLAGSNAVVAEKFAAFAADEKAALEKAIRR